MASGEGRCGEGTGPAEEGGGRRVSGWRQGGTSTLSRRIGLQRFRVIERSFNRRDMTAESNRPELLDLPI